MPNIFEFASLFSSLAHRPSVSGFEFGLIDFIGSWAKRNNVLEKYDLSFLSGGLRFHRKDIPSLPNLVLTAHLDHPGFVLQLLSEQPEETRLYRAHPVGRVPFHLLPYTRVQLYSANDQVANSDRPAPPRGYGKIRPDRNIDGSDNPTSFIIESESSDNGRAHYAVYDLPAAKIVGDRLYSRSIDDLVGVTLCLMLLATPLEKVNLTVLFTRGEEEGATGFKRILMGRNVNPADTIVAVETSKFTEDALPGEGFAIRTEDAARPYSSEVVQFLEKAARLMPSLQWQLAGASDGKTEAASALGLGYQAAAISIPLMGYHNVENNKIVPESVVVNDIEQALEYLPSLAKAFPSYAYSKLH